MSKKVLRIAIPAVLFVLIAGTTAGVAMKRGYIDNPLTEKPVVEEVILPEEPILSEDTSGAEPTIKDEGPTIIVEQAAPIEPDDLDFDGGKEEGN